MDLLVLGRSCLVEIEYIVRSFHKQNMVGGYTRLRALFKQLLAWYRLYEKAKDKLLDAGFTDADHVDSSMQMLLKAMEDRDYIVTADLLEIDMKPLLYDIQAILLMDPVRVTNFDLFYKNVQVLKMAEPELFGMLAMEKLDLAGLERLYEDMVSEFIGAGVLEPASSGFATFAFEQDGRRFYAHSNVNPMWEAIEQAEQYYDISKDEYLLAGMGLGYLPGALLEIDDGISLVIYETKIDVIRMAMLVIDLSWMAQGNVRIVYDSQGTAFVDCLSEETVPILHYPSLQAMANKKLKEQMEQLFINDVNIREYRHSFQMNFRENIKNCSKYVDTQRSHFDGKNAIIVSAGPSLANNIELLRQVPKGTLVIATGTVFKRLLGMGVRPDYVVVLDQHILVYGQVEGICDETVPILVAGTACKAVAQHYAGPKYLICQRENNLTTELAAQKGYTLFESGGNVSILALDICLRLGCQEIAFVGLDMAYTNGLTHEKGLDKYVESNAEDLIPIPGVLGDEVYTSKTFHMFRQRIEAKIAGLPPFKVIDATEGGAVKKGMQVMTLKEVFQRWE